jgi:hypothetical protein
MSAPALEYGLLEPDEVELLTDLVRQCYGNDYAHAYFYQPDRLRELLLQKKLFSAVARTAGSAGKRMIVAHMAVKLEYSGDRTADNFAGMMLKEYRGKGVLMQLGTVLFPVYESLQLLGLQTSTVTHHTISQKISSNTGTISCGCLLADSPGSNAEGLKFNTRMPIIMQFYPFHSPPPRKLFVPDYYQALVAKIFRQLDFPLSFNNRGNAPSPPISEIEESTDQRRGTALLRYRCIGEDAGTLLDRFLATTATLQAIYVDVPLTDATADTLISAANKRGWFFGGIIFERANTDFLRLQRCELPPPATRSGVIDEFSRELMEDILQDYDRIAIRGKT